MGRPQSLLRTNSAIKMPPDTGPVSGGIGLGLRPGAPQIGLPGAQLAGGGGGGGRPSVSVAVSFSRKGTPSSIQSGAGVPLR
jgi:hypothetical protein